MNKVIKSSSSFYFSIWTFPYESTHCSSEIYHHFASFVIAAVDLEWCINVFLSYHIRKKRILSYIKALAHHNVPVSCTSIVLIECIFDDLSALQNLFHCLWDVSFWSTATGQSRPDEMHQDKIQTCCQAGQISLFCHRLRGAINIFSLQIFPTSELSEYFSRLLTQSSRTNFFIWQK